MTKLTYLNDTYLFESNATFIETRETEKGKAVILDETIFYPQGGGQPSDKGEIISDNAKFVVTDVRLDEEGVVWHFGKFDTGEFKKGDKVQLKIDSEIRITNSKLHSAGHLIDCAVTKMGIDNIEPTKGYHFSNGPYIEYKGELENPSEIIPELEKTVNELIQDNLGVEVKSLSVEEAKEEGVYAPAGKGARVVNFSGFKKYGCGGTHINNTQEIGKINILKIKSKSGIIRVSYSVE
ncbi:MAG: alanine--tRNA ligase-related protein [Candidatus Gracilibacteria bacterium]|nr:alanine--tRNA ligase-related protein [Candidatus Gracilibacteria bacterium]